MTGALNQQDAAAYLGVCVNTFKVQVRPYVKRAELGRRMLFPVAELDRWLDEQATCPAGEKSLSFSPTVKASPPGGYRTGTGHRRF